MVFSLIGDLIGNLIGNDENAPGEHETIAHCFKPGVLLDTGVYWVQDYSNIAMFPKQFLRKVLIAGVTVGTCSAPHSTKCDQICRASELPIYMSENDCFREPPGNELCPTKPRLLEKSFGSMRRNFWASIQKCKMYAEEASDVAEGVGDSVKSFHKYLSKECEETTRYGVVGAGALTGLLLGFRGGFIRKIFYSGIGAYAMCAICYPEPTKQYTNEGLKEARKYATITYNFIFGVKKDEILLPQFPQLPKLPSSFGEVWEIAGDLSKSASSLISGEVKEDKQEHQIEDESKKSN